MSNYGTWLYCFLFVGLCMPLGRVCAHDQLYELSLEELLDLPITSASKSKDAVGDIPASVTIVTRNDIALMGYTTLEELLMNVPGFYHIDTYEDFQIGVRGTIGGSIAFLVNGVPLHPTHIKSLTVPDRSRTNFPIDSIDRVEIIRGPASVIYGNNAFFGSVNIVTNEARQKDKFVLESGDSGSKSFFLRLSDTGLDGQSVFNIGASRRKGIDGEYIEYMSERQYGQYSQNITSNLMRSGFGNSLEQERLSFDFSGNRSNLNYGVKYSTMHYGFYALSPAFDQGAKINLNSWVGNLEYKHPFGSGHALETSMIVSEERYLVDPDFVLAATRGYQNQSSRRVESELIWKKEGDSDFQWLTGLNYRKMEEVKNEAEFPDIPFYRSSYVDDINSLAFFANSKYRLTNKLRVIAGYRHTDIFNYSVRSDNRNDNGVAAPSSVDISSRGDDTVNLGFVWRSSDKHMFKLLAGSATQDNSSLDLIEPEQIHTYEFNYNYTSDSSALLVSVFHNDIEKILRRSVRGRESRVFISEDNNAHWKTSGVEWLFTYRPVENMMFELSAVHQQSEDLSVEGVTLVQHRQTLLAADDNFYTATEDKVVANSPENLVKLKFGYGLGDWRFSTSAFHVGAMHALYGIVHDVASDQSLMRYCGLPVSGYTALSFNLRYRKERAPWYINFHGFNVNDADIRYPSNELVNFEYGSPGPAQGFSISVGFDGNKKWP